MPAALSGAAACLFVREIADLRRFSRRVYRASAGSRIAFVVLAFANWPTSSVSAGSSRSIGNLIFVGAAVFTLVVAFMAWRRGSRAAGWFLIAWGLLEWLTIATAVRLLLRDTDGSEVLLYYGLPLSMVAAAVFIALGVADRLREQRVALTDAERRAQTDPLTGVLNRRSIVERLEAACLRARARGLPISLLFIDLDHFKEINDTYGHAAGDACLRAIIEPIHAELRQSDVDRALRRRGIRRDPEQRGRGGGAPDRAAHPRARRAVSPSKASARRSGSPAASAWPRATRSVSGAST